MVVILVSSLLLAAGNPQAGSADPVTVFENVRVFDGETVIDRTTVVVEKGRIARMGLDVAVPRGAATIDGRGKTLLPGLIDGHTHTFVRGQLVEAAAFGVTTTCDMFTSHEFAAEMRREQAEGGARDRANLLSAGIVATAPGGHGTQFGIDIPTLVSASQAAPFVRDRFAEGSDYLKIICEDGSALGGQYPALSNETVTALIEAARAESRMAVAHATARETARHLIRSQVHGLVHIFVDEPPDDEMLELARENKLFIVPTLTVEQGLTGTASGVSLIEDAGLGPFISPQAAANLAAAFPKNPNARASFEVAQQAVRRFHKAGVPILAGTDAPNPGTAHGASMHRELELLVEAGLSPIDALRAATSLPARHFGLADRGRIATGLQADLLLVEGDPTHEITATRRIAGVWRDGQPIDRDVVREQVAAARRAAAAPPPNALAAGKVSDFEGTEVTSAFGSGWMISTDSFAGGKSTAAMALAEPGASETRRALRVHGTIADNGSRPRWGGVMFSPGEQPFAPADLSAKKGFSLWAKGRGKTLQVMLFTTAGGVIPAMQDFEASEEWTELKFSFKQFNNSDGKGVNGIFIGAGTDVGDYEFFIDEVRLVD